MALKIETGVSLAHRWFTFKGRRLVKEVDFAFDYPRSHRQQLEDDLGLIGRPLGTLMLDLLEVPSVRIVHIDTQGGQKIKVAFTADHESARPEIQSHLFDTVHGHFPKASIHSYGLGQIRPVPSP